MRFFVVRHGETSWNREGRFQGQIDVELNETGLRQAAAAAERLAGHRFEAAVTSPLSRAKTTAEKITGKALCREFIIEKGFIEINHGEWEGRTADEVTARWGALLAAWHDSPETVKMPGNGESLKDVYARTSRAADIYADKYGGDVLLTSHDAVIKTLLLYWLGAPLSSFWRFQIPNCSITVAEIISGRPPRILLMSDAGHIGNPFDRPEQKGL